MSNQSEGGTSCWGCSRLGERERAAGGISVLVPETRLCAAGGISVLVPERRRCAAGGISVPVPETRLCGLLLPREALALLPDSGTSKDIAEIRVALPGDICPELRVEL